MAGPRYSAVAILLHWVIAAAIIGQIGLGLVMVQLPPSPMRQFQMFQLHKSIGVTILLLVALRVLWRLANRPPPLPAGMPAAERRAASGAHLLLYLLMIGLPLTGWAVVSASPLNIPTLLYGSVPWPHLPVLSTLADKKPVEAALKLLHNGGAFVLIGLVTVHVLAALRHAIVLRDGVLARMLPWAPRARPERAS